MLRNRNIAFFIDVDNVGLKNDNYTNVMEQLNGMGTILLGKIYGAGERKHKQIFADAETRGYKIERPMRIKRRGRKDFDPRIFVDVVDAVNHAPAIDAVCIVAQPTDLVYLYSYLHARGIKIIALDNADDASVAFVDEVVDLGIVLELKPPKAAPARRSVAKPAATVTETAAPVDRTDELLREIASLREAIAVKPQPEPEPVVEQPSEDAPRTEDSASIVDEAKQLLERIAAMRQESEAAQPQPQPQPEPVAEPEPQPEPVEEAAPAARPTVPTSDGDLVRKIEEIRRNSKEGDDDYIEEIRKLLDGLE